MKKNILEIDLPRGFKYPDFYVDYVDTNRIPTHVPWFFLCETVGLVSEFYELAKQDYPNRKLIPFARYDGTDDVACFDGDDLSGNPKVHLVHFWASAGWEDRGSLTNFKAWLALAKKESGDYIID